MIRFNSATCRATSEDAVPPKDVRRSAAARGESQGREILRQQRVEALRHRGRHRPELDVPLLAPAHEPSDGLVGLAERHAARNQEVGELRRQAMGWALTSTIPLEADGFEPAREDVSRFQCPENAWAAFALTRMARSGSLKTLRRCPGLHGDT
jgi:hypothetical protein